MILAANIDDEALMHSESVNSSPGAGVADASDAPIGEIDPSGLRRARWGVMLFFLLAGWIFAPWAVRIPDIKRYIGADDGIFGLVLLGMAGGSIVAMSSAGWLSSIIGSKRLALVGGLGVCVLAVTLGLAPSPMTLFVALALFGAFYGLMDVAMNTQAVVVEKMYQRPIMSSFHGGFSFATLTGALLGALLVQHLSTVMHLLLTGLVLIAVALVAYRWLAPVPEPASEGGPVFVLPTGPLLPLGVIALAVFLAEGAVADWSAIYLREHLGTTAVLGALGYTMFAVTMTIGRFTGDWVVTQIGPERVVRWGGVLVVAGLGGALMFPSVPTMLLGFACVGLGLAAGFPVAITAAGQTGGAASTAAVAAVVTAGYAGFIIGPAVIGQVSSFFGLRSGLLVVVAMGLLMILLAKSVAPRRASA